MEALRTIFDGVEYRSRLEARFAEFLRSQCVSFDYEPGFWLDCHTGITYVPDFFLGPLDLAIEVKPLAFLSEINVLWDDIMRTGVRWICVDQLERGHWSIIGRRFNFYPGVTIPVSNVVSFHWTDDRELLLEINGLYFA